MRDSSPPPSGQLALAFVVASEPEPEPAVEPSEDGRKGARRTRTITTRRLTLRLLQQTREEYPTDGPPRPRTRGDCAGVPRPCPFVSCKHHLYIDVTPRTGSIKLNWPDIEPGDMRESCALDVADKGEATLDDIGKLLNMTKEAARLVEVRALAALELSGALPSKGDLDG